MPTLPLADDLHLHYGDENPQATRTIVLLHGLGANGSSWRPQVPALMAAGYRVLAPDLRGFGRSSYPGQTGIAEMAGDVAHLLRTVGDGPAHIVGLSMGGTVALQLALEQPALVRSLVLANTSARLRPWRLDGWVYYGLRYALLYLLTHQTQARLVARRTFPHPEQEELRCAFAGQILQANPYAYRGALRALAFFNVLDSLAQVQAPTLVVSGEHDRTIPLATQRLLAEGIPGARHTIIPGAGHGVTADRPALFNQAMLDFLQETPC